MNYQWYPGHMTKARRQMQEDIKLIDLIIEIIDARIPMSSRNPEIDELGKNKSRIVLLNKSDLSNSEINKKWIEYFESKGIFCMEINSKNGYGINKVNNLINEACAEKIERDRKRGIINRPVRAMVVGIPNVGKSTFINALAKKSCAKTGNKPGVTKGKQWIKISKSVELLDTPGILWPKFEDNVVGMRLAFIGSINDEILIPEELASDFIEYTKSENIDGIWSKYNIAEDNIKSSSQILMEIANARGCLKKGGEADITKAASLLIEDFRAGNLGKISLEKPMEN